MIDWIDFEKRQPERDGFYLLLRSGKDILQSEWNAGKWWNSLGVSSSGEDVTHWAYINYPDDPDCESGSLSAQIAEEDWLEFWSAYPRKDNKKKAHTAFKRLPQYKRRKAIEDAPKRYKDVERRFVPLPTTYIHGERWDDELPKQTSNKRSWGGV